MSVGVLFKRFARQTVPQAVILLYHRVADNDFDPQMLCVSPKNFADHMEVLRNICHPISLGALSELKLFKFRPPRSVVVTFDDGYADNFMSAKSILQRYEIPATVFVSTGFISSKQVPYWDELAYIFLQMPALPPILSLLVYGEMKAWVFDSEPPVDVAWNVIQECKLARQDAYRTLCDYLRSQSPHMREEVMAEIRKWLGKDGMDVANNKFMTVEQLERLTENGLIDVGAHTIMHPDLASLPAQEQRREIIRGRRQLEEITGYKVCSFAYPYGSRDNYSHETMQILQEEGFDCACSNFGGTVWYGTNRYQLPRVLVRNWSAEEFAGQILSFFETY